MICLPSRMYSTAGESTTADATIGNMLECAEKLMSMGPILVRFRANRGGFAALARFRKCVTDPSNPYAGFQGVPIHESDDYADPSKPARVVAVLRDPRTGLESEKLVYGEVA